MSAAEAHILVPSDLLANKAGLITRLWEYGDTLHADKTFRG